MPERRHNPPAPRSRQEIRATAKRGAMASQKNTTQKQNKCSDSIVMIHGWMALSMAGPQRVVVQYVRAFLNNAVDGVATT